VRITAYDLQDLGDGYLAIQSSNGQSVVSDNLDELLRFLRYSSKDTIRVFFDLDEVVAPILRKIPKQQLEQVADLNPAVNVGEHHFFYYHDRVLQVGWTRFFGLKTFYGYPEYAPILSLNETKQMAEEVMSTLDRMGIGDTNLLTSAVACFESSELGKQTYAGIPKGWEISPSCYEVLDYADQADHKDWVEARQIGHWESGLYDWDKTSCYMSLASKLYDLRDCEFWKSDALGKREQGASYGFARGSFYIYPDGEYSHCSPIVATVVNDLPGNPVGRIPVDIYSLEEMRTVERYGIGEFDFIDGWFIKVMNGVRPRFPFKSIMNYLYDKRAISPLASSIAKGIGNQIVGKLIQRRESDNSIRNEIYHALVTSGARCEITRFLVDNDIKPGELVSIQTDGVRTTRKLPESISNGLGSWHCNGDFPTIVVSPRKVYCQDKKPYRITYADILEMVDGHPQSDRYSKRADRHITLAQAKAMGDIYRVGEYASASARFDLLGLGSEQCRVFPELPRTGKRLLSKIYPSTPVVL